MKPKVELNWPALLLGMLTLLLQACASGSLPISPPSVAPPRIPALPREARQPEIPSECLGGCSANLTIARQRWQSSLISPVSPASLAKPPMTDYGLLPKK